MEWELLVRVLLRHAQLAHRVQQRSGWRHWQLPWVLRVWVLVVLSALLLLLLPGLEELLVLLLQPHVPQLSE